MREHTQSPLQRIKRVMDYHQKKGYNSERCNALYKKIINEKFNKNKKQEGEEK